MRRILILFLFLTAWLLAQGPEMAPWWDSPIVRDLNLSEDQQKQIRAVVRDFRDRLIQQRADVQKAEGDLRDLMNEERVNEARVNEAIDKVVAARGAMMKSVSSMSLKLRMVLTPDQWRELQRRSPEGRGLGRGPAPLVRPRPERLPRGWPRGPRAPGAPGAQQPPPPGLSSEP